MTSLGDEHNIIQNRGPIVLEPVTDGLEYHNITTGRMQSLKAGKYIHAEPGTSFYISSSKKQGDVNLVIFEIKLQPVSSVKYQ